VDDRTVGRRHRYGYSAVIQEGKRATLTSLQDFIGEPVARVQLPARIPLGFHGNWIPD
jgi:carotenoid cleavage dioxygenase-like enzyme